MLTKENFNESHIRMLQKQSKKDPALLERAVFAFGLLEAIRWVEMPFNISKASTIFPFKQCEEQVRIG